jgi:HK97 family phage prohead protease
MTAATNKEGQDMPAKVNEREYRQINFGQIEIREMDDGKKIVEGYATTFDQEYTLYSVGDYELRESIDRHAFDETDMKDVIMQYDHEGRVFARKSNGTLQLETDDHGLKIRADLGGTEIGRQLYEEIKGGYTTKMSFGFTVSKQERTEEEIEGKVIIHRKITGIKKLFDVSAVSLPANDATEITSRNLGEGLIAEVKQEKLAREARERQKTKIRMLMEV